jgi:hypothetical protein
LINLLPSSATLSHLEYLKVTECKGLKNLITSQAMQSLDKLRTLKVEDCSSLEEVITGDEEIHITLMSLQKLVLKRLPSLNQFSSKNCSLKFPLLEVVILRVCPSMKVFSEGYISTPNLRQVKIAKNDEGWFWKGNINDTITSMFEDKVRMIFFLLIFGCMIVDFFFHVVNMDLKKMFKGDPYKLRVSFYNRLEINL